jgi:uncharacterized protein (TIGR02284 family)
MNSENTINALNSLVKINNDRFEGYESASKLTDEQDLKNLFGILANTSKRNNLELSDEILKMRGQPTENTNATGKFFRAWMDVKAALTGNDRKSILNSCEYGEGKAIDTYEKVLKDDRGHLSRDQQSLIHDQQVLIKADHNKVKLLIAAQA